MTALIIMIIVILIGLLLTPTIESDDCGVLGQILFGLDFIAFVVLFGIVISGIGIKPVSYDTKIIETKEIVAFNDDSQVNGNIGLFGGYIGEDMYYAFYYKVGDGYKADKVKADNTTIIESDSEIPRVDHVEIKPIYKDNFDTFRAKNTSIDKRYIIYVPVGTIIQEFNGDLQ